MRSLVSKSFRFSVLVVVLLFGRPAHSATYHLYASPDTLFFTSNVGQLQVQYLSIWDDRDTNGPHLPLTHVYLHLTGSTDFDLNGNTDSSVSFFHNTSVGIRCTSHGQFPSTATVFLTDSLGNTARVVLVNKAPPHSKLYVSGNTAFDSLRPNIDSCHTIWVYNPNPFSVSVLSVTTNSQANYHVQNVTFPVRIGSDSSMSFSLCVTGVAGVDPSYYSSLGGVAFNFGSGIDTAYFETSGHNFGLGQCLLIQSNSAGGLEGQTDTSNVFLTNENSSSVTVDSAKVISDPHGVFRMSPAQFPFNVSFQQQYFHFTFSAPLPSRQDQDTGTVAIWTHGTYDNLPCDMQTSPIYGGIYIPFVDSVFLDVPPGSNTLSMTTNTRLSYHRIVFHNVSANRIKLLNVSVLDSNGIAFMEARGQYSVSFSEDTLSPGNYSYSTILLLQTNQPGNYAVHLLLNYENDTPAYYTIQVHSTVTPLSSVAPRVPAPPFDFTMNPNPARGEVTISLPDAGRSTVEIYDVLGNLMLREEASGEFVWPAKGASGSYIVRVVTRREDGSLASRSKRLVLVR